MRHPLVLAALAPLLAAQEAIHTTAATQPGVGRAVLREQVHWYVSDSTSTQTRLDELRLDSTLFVGLRHDIAVGVQVPAHALLTDTPTDRTTVGELGDVQVLGKVRFLRRDTGPIDTERASLILGLHCDTADAGTVSLRPDFARGSFDPIVGAVWTQIDGRVGLDAAVQGTLSTGGHSDDFSYDGAWLYRLDPATFANDSDQAWYLVTEINGHYETNGDNQLLVSPGLMYETKRLTFEVSVQLPAWQDLDHRPELDFAVVLGVRFLF